MFLGSIVGFMIVLGVNVMQFMYLNQFPELWNSMENHVAQMLDETPAL